MWICAVICKSGAEFNNLPIQLVSLQKLLKFETDNASIGHCILMRINGFLHSERNVCTTHRRAPLLLERSQEKIRAREMLKVLSTETYRTDSRIMLDTGAYRRQYPSPFPPPHTILRKAQISHMINLHTSMVLSLCWTHRYLWLDLLPTLCEISIQSA